MLIKGKGIPVEGKTPTATPILITASMTMKKLNPTARSLESLV
jgi:hypothetical protein